MHWSHCNGYDTPYASPVPQCMPKNPPAKRGVPLANHTYFK